MITMLMMVMDGLTPPRLELSGLFIFYYMLGIELAGTVLGAWLIRSMVKIRFAKAFNIMGLTMSVTWFLGLLSWYPITSWEHTVLVRSLATMSLLWALASLFWLWGYRNA